MTDKEYLTITNIAEGVNNRTQLARTVIAQLADKADEEDTADALWGLEKLMCDNIADLNTLRGDRLVTGGDK